jgi:hypothetical protein
MLMVPPAEANFHQGVKGAVKGARDAVTHPGRSAEYAKGKWKIEE